MKLNGSSGGKHSAAGREKNRAGSKPDKVFGEETASLTPELQKQIKKAGASNAGNVRAQKDSTSGAKKPPEKRKWRGWLVAAVCVLAVVCAAAVAYSIWEKPPDTSGSSLREPLVTPTAGPTATPGPEETPEPTVEPTPEPNLRKDDCYTFLLAAMDQIGANTDVLIVGRMDTAEGTLDLVSIPRDTLMNVSYSVKKAGTMYAFVNGDIEKIIENLGAILGFEPDCYAVVNIKAVEKLVDCIGGVYYTVPRNMDYDDPSQDFHVHIPAGEQWLSGEDAVKVLRFRMGNDDTGYVNGDLGRIATQQDFLMSIASQMLTLGNIPNLTQAIDIFQENVKTDLEGGNIAFFARQFLMMDRENISFSTLPGEGIGVLGGSYYEIDLDGWLDMINTRLNPFTRDVSADMLDILQYASGRGLYSTSGTLAG